MDWGGGGRAMQLSEQTMNLYLTDATDMYVQTDWVTGLDLFQTS